MRIILYKYYQHKALYYEARGEISKLLLCHLVGDDEFYDSMLDKVQTLALLHNIQIEIREQ